MIPKYTVIIYTPQELNHSSYMHAGLFELQKTGFIKVKVVLNFSKRLGRTIIAPNGNQFKSRQSHPKTSFGFNVRQFVEERYSIDSSVYTLKKSVEMILNSYE